ncbi:MAG TPA: cyclic nucleotide-binding domain-containing protein [Pyrinomonadaceae bacterium]|nr:cyclic nucleotide-binding domain-containing protein [Pyrinomonadaceae bacterium]
MPREITDREALVNAVKNLELTSELFEEQNGKPKYGTDLEVIVNGREYGNGKRVGPYVRLLQYGPGEEIMRQGEWGGNTFYINVTGLLDVFIADGDGGKRRINQLHPGTCFGEMALLAGVERNATVAVPADESATVLEVSRPALRLLRKLPRFGHALDDTYRRHGFGRILEDLSQLEGIPLEEDLVEKLRSVAKFMVYGKHHVLCQEDEQIDKVILIKSGWIRRVRGVAFDAAMTGIAVSVEKGIGVDFLGAGNCLGLEGVTQAARWRCSASVMARTEVLEIPIALLASEPKLRARLKYTFSTFSRADDRPPLIEAVPDVRALISAEEEIATGIVDGSNLLIMDMDLCVRCGNCSLACHQVHGQSRLLRRGISISRPSKTGLTRMQHALSPQVCMHCKDPECLTGCPTGSIFRDPVGHVDIDPHTCIGCFDCATQCPYDAITMVPRTSAPEADFDLFGTLKRGLSLKSPEPPAAPPPADEVVAIKCNLCDGTSLNPHGASRQAYSCEENCPTGALVRVNPVEYFDEIASTRGIVFRDQHQAFGRNIHKSDPLSRMWHVGGGGAVLLATIAVIWALARYGLDERLASTWVTMRWVTGLTGLFGIAAVMTYPFRKKVYRRRAGALRYWLLAHVYLGTLAGIVLLFHSGTATGGILTTSLYLAFNAVLFSGFFGIASYIVGPRIMTSIEGEPLLVEDLIARREELRKELDEVASESEGWLREEIEERVRKRFLGASFLLRQLIRREELKALLANAREEFKERIVRLVTDDERKILLDAVETAVTLARVDSLIFLHRLLRVWIPPHVIATSLMLALMLVHIIQVLFFAIN